MRIPLDYYRILGLPIQATAEQLRQAHRDRTQQLPRREYSEIAITARKQLLDEAYSVLSDPEQRQAYDDSFLAKTYAPPVFSPNSSRGESASQHERQQTPGTQPNQLGTYGTNFENPLGSGAEKNRPGEEGTKLQSGMPEQEALPYPQESTAPATEAIAKTKKPSITLGGVDPNTPSIEIDDKEFVGALLILQELGEYELVLKLTRPYLSNNIMGLKDGRFGDPALVVPDVVLIIALANLELGREQWQQGEYENAAQSLESGQELLLRENLFFQIRGEIQADLYKLRPYRIIELLALPEEKALARRRGLELLQDMLTERGGIDGQGGDRSGLAIEDFLKFIQQLRCHLTTAEQKTLFEAEARRPSAVATYLAVYTLLAQGFATKQPALIRKAKLMLMQLGRSQDVNLEKAVCALLLGQTEEASRSLELSQEYEPLSFIREHSQNSPDLLPGLCLYAEHWLSEEVFPHFRDLADKSASLKDYFADEHVQAYLEALPTEAEAANQWVVVQPRHGPNLGLQAERQPDSILVGEDGFSPSETMADGFPSVSATGAPQSGISSAGAAQPTGSSFSGAQMGIDLGSAGYSASNNSRRVSRRSSSRLPVGYPAAAMGGDNSLRRASHKKDAAKLRLLLILIAVSLLLLWLVWWLLSWLTTSFGSGGPKLRGEQPTIELAEAIIKIPPIPEPLSLFQPGLITEEVAELAVQTWLETKAAALGPNHAVQRIPEILVGPALSQWLPTARALQRDNSYRKYEHTLEVEEVLRDDNNPDRASVETSVSEKAEFYDDDRLTDTRDDRLRVRYDLVRQNGKWQIRDWQVLR